MKLRTAHKPVSGRDVVKVPCVLRFGGIWLLPYNLFSKILPRVPFSVSDHLNVLLVESRGALRKREAERALGPSLGFPDQIFCILSPSLREENSTAVIIGVVVA